MPRTHYHSPKQHTETIAREFAAADATQFVTDMQSVGDSAGAVSYKCQDRCPFGQHCYLDSSVIHTWHICNDQTCDCHTWRRYQVELRKGLLD